MFRKNKVPLPGIKTWWGGQKYVTPEELAQFEKENAELEELLRKMFGAPLFPPREDS
jgi:hypothetical protein